MKIISKLKKHTTLIIVSLLLIVSILGLSGVFRGTDQANPKLSQIDLVSVDNYYSKYLNEFKHLHIDTEEAYVISTQQLNLDDGEVLNDELVYAWNNDTSILFHVDVAVSGLYLIYFDYVSKTTSHMPISLSIKLNGEEDVPYYEASQISLDSLWREVTTEVGVDRYGNDVSIEQELYEKWQYKPLRDARRLYDDGLYFYLESGENQIEIKKFSGELLLREIKVASKPQYVSYATYLTLHEDQSEPILKRTEAEEAYYKNTSTIVRGINRDPQVLPFSMTKLKLNVLGTDSYDKPGNSVTWIANVDAPGYYHITFKVLQNVNNTTAYRRLYINGEVPFEEAKHLTFSYHNEWQNATLQSFDQEDLLIYLEPGDNITLEVDSTLFVSVAEKLQVIMREISRFGLDVTKLTRNNTDRGIDWDMIEYFPNLYDMLDSWISSLKEINDSLNDLHGFNNESQSVQDLKAAIAKLNQIRSNINEIPRRLTLLSTGSSSALQLIANQIDQIINQPMIVDSFFIHTAEKELPNPIPNFFMGLRVFFGRFFMSFFDSAYSDKADPNELEVWVNRSRQFVDLMQRLTDDQFTNQFGVKVKISLINDDGKLLLANSANQQPDVALGISAWIPNEYGMRGMLYDLSQADGFSETISVYNPEQLIPMVYDNKLYGLPETENFYVLFYRRDILEELDLEVPNTWNDVLDMLPILRRFGMSFYIPLSSNSALKSFDTTAPFIYQYGGKIYSDDGFTGAIDHEKTIEALTFMTDLYREYSTPYQVPSFFNSFRYSDIPIGIGDFGMYLQLTNAASDISGLWDIALVPGIETTQINPLTEQEETVINRFMPGAQQAGIIFEKSNKKTEAWQFLSWWMSTQTQIAFSEALINTLGTRYLWNTANLEAFESLRIIEPHKRIILEQWTHLKEVPKIPGSYIIERELSNTWNSVVYNDANLRSTVSDALIKIDKEIQRKMIEFGYLDRKGNVIKPFILPTVEQVRGWYGHDED